jgi:FtsZ-interacting cell division protein YlmF
MSGFSKGDNVSGLIGSLKEFLMPRGGGPAESSEVRSASVARSKAPRPSRRNNDVVSIETVTPKSYVEAGEIALILREGTPVIVNVSLLTEAEKRRLVDFMAGLKAGLMAESKRVAEDVYLLGPHGVEIDPDSNEVLEAEGVGLIVRP